MPHQPLTAVAPRRQTSRSRVSTVAFLLINVRPAVAPGRPLVV
jgi:hypothetical protein